MSDPSRATSADDSRAAAEDRHLAEPPVRRALREGCADMLVRLSADRPARASPFARSKATCEWLAWFIWTRHALLVPMDRLRRDMSRKGLDLAMSYLVSQVERAADILVPIDGEHWKQLLAGD